MKRWLVSLLMMAPLSVGCGGGNNGSGGGGEGGDGEGGSGGDGGGMVMPKPDSLNRNPQNPLTCDRPLIENANASQLQRLTNVQYVNTMRDLFAGLVPDGALPQKKDFPDELKEGATFSNNVVSQLGSEAATQARETAVVMVSGEAVKDLPKLMGCDAKDQAAEAGCVSKFLDTFGARAWRRPLTGEEKDSLGQLFTDARKELDYRQSVQTVLGAMLQSPQFLYRIQEGTGEVVKDMGKRLSDYEMASSLSYTIWNSMPDGDLFAAAKDGKLATVAQIEAQAKRMLGDDRAKGTVLQVLREWLHVERLESNADSNAKDRGLFSKYGIAQAEGSLKGFEAFLSSSFWDGDHSFKTMMTSTKGFVNDDTAELYGVSKPGKSELTSVDLNKDQRRGVLTQPFFMAGWANDKAQSAILRGAFIMEGILCSAAPPPPPGVVAKIPDVPNRDSMTLRQVIESAIESQDACKACHKIIDGFGFLFDNYDAIGMYRTKERELDLNTTATIPDMFDVKGEYPSAREFSEAVAKSEQAAQCMVQHLYEYVTARPPVEEDGCHIAPLTDGFLANGTDMQKLLVDIIKSPAFRYRSVAQ